MQVDNTENCLMCSILLNYTLLHLINFHIYIGRKKSGPVFFGLTVYIELSLSVTKYLPTSESRVMQI